MIFFYFLAIFFYNCNDSSTAPTWYITINLPLTSTEILFSDIVDDCNHEDEFSCNSNLSNQCVWNNSECSNQLFSFTSDENGEIITLLFQDAIIDSGYIGLNEDLIDFSIPPFSLDAGQNIQQYIDIDSFNENLGVTIDPLNISLSSLTSDLNSSECIPKTAIVNQLNEYELLQSGSIQLPMTVINSIFSEYEYLTLNYFEIIKNISNTNPFDLSFDISISGLNDIYTSIDIVGESIDSSGVFEKEHLIDSLITYNVEISLSDEQTYCTSTIPLNPLDYGENECVGNLEWKTEYCAAEDDDGEIIFLFNISNPQDCFNIGDAYWLQAAPYCLDQFNFIIDESIVNENDCNFFNEDLNIDVDGVWIQPSEYGYQPFCYDPIGFQFSNEDDYNLLFVFGMENINIKSITGILGIPIEPMDESIALTTFNNDDLSFELRGAKLTDDTLNVNKLSLTYQNNSPIDLDLEIILNNFEINNEVLKDTVTISSQSDSSHTILLNSCEFLHEDNVGLDNPDPEKTIENIRYSINILSQESKEYLLDDLDTIDIAINDIQIDTLEFEYLTAAVEEISIQTPGVTFDDIPSGFEGLIFSNPIMELNIYNQIAIENTINMTLLGTNTNNESNTLQITGIIYPPDNLFETQKTCIRVHDNCVDSYKGECGELTCEECADNLNCSSVSSEITLSEFLQNAPVVLEVSDGESIISGSGYLYPNTYVWGEFSLIAPFSLIIGSEDEIGNFEDLNIMPSNPTEIAAIEESTKDMIDNALIEASIVSTIENNSYIIGEASIMVSSNEFFFPLDIDETVEFLNECNENNEIGIGICGDLEIINSIVSLLDNSYLNNIQNSIDKIYFSLNEDISKIKTIEFIDTSMDSDSILLEYGRLINLILPGPSSTSNNLNFNKPFILENYYSSMDTIQLKLINQSDKQKFINTIISLQNSYDINDDGNHDEGMNGNGVVNIYNDDYINIQSYMSFIVNPSGF